MNCANMAHSSQGSAALTMNGTTLLTSLNTTITSNIEDFHKRLQRLYPCVDDVSQLPHGWFSETKAPPLGLTHDNLGCYYRGLGLREVDVEKFAAAVRTENHIPPACLLYYFEIKFISKGREGFMGLGLTSATAVLNKLPGWARESYGYHADDGNIFNGDGRSSSFGPTFTSGDVIGCGYNLVEGKCFFTKNGLNLGKAFEDIPSDILFYPTVGLKTTGEEVKANFGQDEFVYDIEQDLRSLRKNMTLTISNYPIEDYGDWQNSLHKLVQSWLLQNSYPSTAEAFSKMAKIECKDNMQLIQFRNRIQQYVRSGRISEAINLTNRLCPNMLQNNPNLLFALKCRQFIELISGAENDFQPISNYVEANDNNDETITMTSNNNTKNHGATTTTNGVDRMGVNGDQQFPTTKSTATTTTTTTIPIVDYEIDSNEQKFAKLIMFGQELWGYMHQLDKLYGKNESNEKMLRETLGLIAIIDPKNSSYGNLLDPKEREPISQMLNSSILKAEAGDGHHSTPMEDVMSHLRDLVRLNNSQGRWLIDQLY